MTVKDEIKYYVYKVISKLAELFEEKNSIENQEVEENFSEEKVVSSATPAVVSPDDKLNELTTEIEVFELFFPQNYVDFKTKIQSLEDSYEKILEKENNTEIILKLPLDVEWNNLEEKIYCLKTEIMDFKREEFNYFTIKKKLNSLNDILERCYPQAIIKQNPERVVSYQKIFDSILSEIQNMEFATNKEKEEEINIEIGKAIYMIHKTCICYGMNSDNFYLNYLLFKNEIVEIFLQNVKDLLARVEHFKVSKYYVNIRSFFENIFVANVDNLFQKSDFWKKFIEYEKRTLELDYYNTKQNNAIEILQWKNFFANVLKEDKNNKQLKIVVEIFNSMSSDIGCHEVYRVIYLLGLSNFFKDYLKKVPDALIKKALAEQKDISLEAGNGYLEILNVSKTRHKEIRSVFKSLNIDFCAREESNRMIVGINQKYFENCQNILAMFPFVS